MSAGTSTIANKYDQLMRQMGSTDGAWCPMPDKNYLFFLKRCKGESELQRVLAWLRLKTIGWRPGTDRTSYAQDERGVLKLTHLAADLELSLSNASQTWSLAESYGLARRDEEKRLCLCADVPELEQSPEQDELISTTHFANSSPEYLRRWYQSLSSTKQEEIDRTYGEHQARKRRILADAAAEARKVCDHLDDKYFAHFGMKLDRRVKKEKPGQDPPRKSTVQLTLLPPEDPIQEEVVQDERSSVQEEPAKPVQSENGTVQESSGGASLIFKTQGTHSKKALTPYPLSRRSERGERRGKTPSRKADR